MLRGRDRIFSRYPYGGAGSNAGWQRASQRYSALEKAAATALFHPKIGVFGGFVAGFGVVLMKLLKVKGFWSIIEKIFVAGLIA